VLVHAIIDALLGATGLGDIGIHFPSSDRRYRDISSVLLLRQVASLLRAEEWVVRNVDASVIAERPKLTPFAVEMRRIISEALGIDVGQVGVKSTTSKGLGFLGKGEGIAVHAVALVEKAGEDRRAAAR
jgi:2-C-methyl-D-erythritol 2,4-cyclodiphosphate synthase